jgi:hypothetical protein
MLPSIKKPESQFADLKDEELVEYLRNNTEGDVDYEGEERLVFWKSRGIEALGKHTASKERTRKESSSTKISFFRQER